MVFSCSSCPHYLRDLLTSVKIMAHRKARLSSPRTSGCVRGRHPARSHRHRAVRGPDRYRDGCHAFRRLSAREPNRPQPDRIGPRRDELGTFATFVSRFGHLPPGYAKGLRVKG